LCLAAVFCRLVRGFLLCQYPAGVRVRIGQAAVRAGDAALMEVPLVQASSALDQSEVVSLLLVVIQAFQFFQSRISRRVHFRDLQIPYRFLPLPRHRSAPLKEEAGNIRVESVR